MTITLEINDGYLPSIAEYLKTQCTATIDKTTGTPGITYHYAGAEDFIRAQVNEMLTGISRMFPAQ